MLDKYEVCFYNMPVPGGYGSSLHDFVGCINGRFFSIEAKAGRNKMTDRQTLIAANMVKANAKVFLVNDDPETFEALKRYLDEASNAEPCNPSSF